MSQRKPQCTHSFLGLLVCDWCGFKVKFDKAGRSEMEQHLAAEHDSP